MISNIKAITEIRSFNSFNKKYGIEAYERSGCIHDLMETRCWICPYKHIWNWCLVDVAEKENIDLVKIEYRG